MCVLSRPLLSSGTSNCDSKFAGVEKKKEKKLIAEVTQELVETESSAGAKKA